MDRDASRFEACDVVGTGSSPAAYEAREGFEFVMVNGGMA
jgi:hypothetical protein